MLSNIFVKVVLLLKEKKFNIDCDALISFLSYYHVNEWIYPDAIHRELSLDIKIVYEILELCVEEGLLEQYLQIYCPKCQRFTGNFYRTALEIPEFVNCVHCDTEIETPLQHAIVIYKVIL